MVKQRDFLKQIKTHEYLLFMQNNWEDRHNIESQKKYGVWRWLGMKDNAEYLLKIIKKSKKIIDFGGAQAPLCPDALIVDKANKDIWGRDIKYHNVSDCPGKYDLIFSSHTLEHVIDFKFELIMMIRKLKSGGRLILHLPSVHNDKWWPQNERKKEHKRIFALSKEPVSRSPLETIYIDQCFFKDNIEYAEYVGDSGILLSVVL